MLTRRQRISHIANRPTCYFNTQTYVGNCNSTATNCILTRHAKQSLSYRILSLIMPW